MKRKKIEEFGDQMARLFPQPIDPNDKERHLIRTVTWQVTDGCNLRCTYCYQINKKNHIMSWDVAKRFCDMLLDATKENNDYINPDLSPGLIMEFIGGEPFLAVDLIDQICDYMVSEMIKRQHPWATRYMISICSNGVLYFDTKVQAFLKKWRDHLSFSITVDGCKELHDACRVFPDGSGSYDLAIAGVQHYKDVLHGEMGSKMTIAPGNVQYVLEAIKNFVSQGYTDINLNCVYEEGWTTEHAKVLYDQLVKAADYLLENNLDEEVLLSIFQETFFHPKDESDDQNWCWSKGTPILTTDGYKPIEEIKIGDKVYTEDGTIHPVINTMQHFADNCVEIKSSGTFPMICTDNHKLYAQPYDYIGNKGKKHYKNYGTYEIKNLNKSQDLLRMSTLPDNRIINVDKNLAKLVGRFIGDGWYSDSNGYAICCGFDEIDELTSMFNEAKVSYYSYRNKTVEQIYCSRRNKDINNDAFSKLASDCGHLATGKRVPTECLSWDNESLQALIDGYVSADGSVKGNKVKIKTVSYELANDIMLILRTLGYFPTCYFDDRGGVGVIQNRTVHINCHYEIYYYLDKKKSRYIQINNNKLFTSHLQVKKAPDQQVYNITVDTNHSYFAGSLVSSNCGGLGSMLSCDWKGDLYPCIRYMESSLGEDVEPVKVGNVYDGILSTAQERQTFECMKCITRRSQSTDECFYCPIAEGCSWCFPAGTKIRTPNGYENIENLKENDEVIDMNGDIQKVESCLVREVSSPDLILIKPFDKEEIIVTKEHPFFVKANGSKDGQWVVANDIFLTDELAEFTNNKEEPIKWIKIEKLWDYNLLNDSNELIKVYNLTVSNTHTFIANDIIVHNCSAYNYQDTGSYNKRATHICVMHKARALANAYFWNMKYMLRNEPKVMHLYIPDDWAIPIIGEEELNKLKALEEMCLSRGQ